MKLFYIFILNNLFKFKIQSSFDQNLDSNEFFLNSGVLDN
jgi:hypothetical protein